MASQLTIDSPVFSRRMVQAEARTRVWPSFDLVRTALIAALIAAPLAFGAVQPWGWGVLAIAAFLLFFLWSIASARQGRVRILWSPLYLPAGIFFLTAMVQYAGHFTMDRVATREALVKMGTDLIFFFLAGQLFPELLTPRSPRSVSGMWYGKARIGEAYILSLSGLRWTLVLYTFILSLFAIFQFFSSQGLIYWRVPSPGWTFGPYVNHNHYAGLMEMLIPLAIASALPGLRRHPSAVLLGFGLLIPVASLLLSGSRGGFMAFMAEIVLAAVLVFIYGPRHARRVVAAVGGAALLAAGLLFIWMAPREVAERLAKLGGAAHPSEVELGHRLAAARDALGIWRDHPWLGAGLGSFETAFPRYLSFPSDARWDHAHNDYAEALADTGLAGAVAILAAIVLFCRLAFGNLRLRHRAGWLPFAAALGCSGILVHSFADFNLHMPANAAWLAFCAALATVPPQVKGDK